MYETPKSKIVGTEDDDPGFWARDLLIKNSNAEIMQPDRIKRMNKKEFEQMLFEVLKQKYFFQFRSKMAGKVGIYETPKYGETPRLIAFKLYGDPLKARDLIKMNPELKHEEQPLDGKIFVFYVIPEVTKIYRKDGIPFNVVKKDWITKISKEIYHDMVKWIDIWKQNVYYVKNPHLIMVGDLLYWYPSWYKKRDGTERNLIPKRRLSSSEAEGQLIMDAQENSPPSLKQFETIQYEEYR